MHTHENIHFHQLELTSCSGNRPRGLYLNLLTDGDILLCDGKNYIAHKCFPDVFLMEVKGTFAHAWKFDLQAAPDYFWLCFQFTGVSDRAGSTGARLTDMQYQGIWTEEGNIQVEVGAGKVSLVLLGLQITDQASFQLEWPALATLHADDAVSNIGYRINRLFGRIEQYTDLPYSTGAKMQYHIYQLLDIYNNDIEAKMKGLQEESALYHLAIAYITKHYQDKDIDTKKIAERLHTSVRNLYRAFEDKHTTIKSAIQTIRLYKGRELLRETKSSVDMIALQLNFSTAKYFAKQFALLFGHSPAKERQLNAYSKKELRKIQRMRRGSSI